MAIKLFDYQQKAVDEIESEIMFGDSNRILLDACPAYGKTFTACKIAIESEYKTIISLSYSALINQFVESFKAMEFDDFTVIKANHEIKFDPNARVIISMENTMHARLEQYKKHIMDFELVICDEIHNRIYGNRLREILDTINPDYVIGMSGTPYTAYGSRLKTFNKTIRTITTKELTQMGKLTPIKYLINPKIFLTKRNYKSLSEFSEEDLAIYLTDDYIGMIINDFMNNQYFEPQQTKSIWFCNSVASAKKYAEKLREAGYMAIAYHGKMKKDYEEKVMNSFKNNEPVDLTTDINLFNYDKLKKHRVMGLVSVAKLSVGFSVEDINVGVYTYPTNSITKWYQSVGRIARKHPTKSIAYLMDYGRNIELFGTTEDIYEPPLEDTEYKEGEFTQSNEKKAIAEQVSMPNLDCVCKDNLSIINRDIYDIKINNILNDTRAMSEMTPDEKLDKFIVLNDDFYELTLLYMAIFKDTWGDSYTYMKYNKQTNKEELKEVSGYYKESTVKWIAEHWINTINKNNLDKKEMIKTFKNVARKNIKNKKNIYAIRFFIDYIVNNELTSKIEDNTDCPISMLYFYIDYANKHAFCSEYELENHNYERIDLNDFLELNNGKTTLDLVPLKLEPQEYNPEFIDYIDEDEIPF